MTTNSNQRLSEETYIGTPEQDINVWHGQQSYSDTCAIVCQEFIIEQFTGAEVSEDILREQALDNGWYTDGGGTPLEDVGNLLELYGIPVNRYDNATSFDIAAELAQGHKIIIGVDSGELWQTDPALEELEDYYGIAGADHAVVVSGIDTTDPDNICVIVSDPGNGDPMARIPYAEFVNAWEDSNCFMVATQDPAPAGLPEMANFDYEAGHLAEVLDVPFDDFMELSDEPDAVDSLVDKMLGSLEALGLTIFSHSNPSDQIPETDNEPSELQGGLNFESIGNHSSDLDDDTDDHSSALDLDLDTDDDLSDDDTDDDF